MTWLLDTNIVSELTKPQPDPTCEAWLDARATDCAISTVTLSELRFGIERLPEGKKKTERNRDFRFLAEDYHGRFFDFDAPSGFEWGRYAAELYDLVNDVSEVTDVGAQQPDLVKRLESEAEKARDELGDVLTKRTGKGVREPGRLANR